MNFRRKLYFLVNVIIIRSISVNYRLLYATQSIVSFVDIIWTCLDFPMDMRKWKYFWHVYFYTRLLFSVGIRPSEITVRVSIQVRIDFAIFILTVPEMHQCYVSDSNVLDCLKKQSALMLKIVQDGELY